LFETGALNSKDSLTADVIDPVTCNTRNVNIDNFSSRSTEIGFFTNITWVIAFCGAASARYFNNDAQKATRKEPPAVIMILASQAILRIAYKPNHFDCGREHDYILLLSPCRLVSD
jgi:hypothetical protein